MTLDYTEDMLLSGAQIRALPAALEGLPAVERLRLTQCEIPGNGTLTLTGYRRGRYALITPDGTVFRYDADGKRVNV